jgi:type IV pilus assembly protein PilN
MIRINLLAVERERTKRRSTGPGLGLQATQQKITLACSLILVLTGLGVGWWYWSLKLQTDRIEEDIVTSQKETARLRTLIQQVQANDTRRAMLQQRVGLIEELRKGREGPLHMLDEISRSLPDMLWINEIKQQGADLTITGRCTSLTALSDFVDNLKLGGYFKPVEILDSQVEAGATGASATLTRFSIKATFVTIGAEKSVTEK